MLRKSFYASIPFLVANASLSAAEDPTFHLDELDTLESPLDSSASLAIKRGHPSKLRSDPNAPRPGDSLHHILNAPTDHQEYVSIQQFPRIVHPSAYSFGPA